MTAPLIETANRMSNSTARLGGAVPPRRRRASWQLLPQALLLLALLLCSCLPLSAGLGVKCWGGAAATAVGVTSIPTAAQTGTTAVACGYEHVLALSSSGAVTAWGKDSYGQATLPAAVVTGPSTMVAAGDYYSMSVTGATSKTYVWGNPLYSIIDSAPTGTGIRAIAGGVSNAVALLASYDVIAWGRYYGTSTTLLAGCTTCTAVYAGGDGNIAVLKSDGTIRVWSPYGVLGTVPTDAATGVQAVAMATLHICVLKTTGTVICWGDTIQGATTVPAAVQGYAVSIAAGPTFSMAVIVKNNVPSVSVWGNYNAPLNVPTLPSGSTATGLCAGSDFGCLLYSASQQCLIDSLHGFCICHLQLPLVVARRQCPPDSRVSMLTAQRVLYVT